MTTDQLEQAGQALFGSNWQAPLARALGVSDRHMRRMLDSSRSITDENRRKIEELCRRRSIVLKEISKELHAA